MDFQPSDFGLNSLAKHDQFDHFFSQLSSLMDLPQESTAALMDLRPIRGLCGLLCRLRFSFKDDKFFVRPEILTPVLVKTLPSEKLDSLFALQTSLVEEHRWVMAISKEGFLQLQGIDWIDEPAKAVAAMDLGQTFGKLTIDLLRPSH